MEMNNDTKREDLYESVKADSVFSTLRDAGLDVETKAKLNTLRFFSILSANLIFFGFTAYSFVDKYYQLPAEEKPKTVVDAVTLIGTAIVIVIAVSVILAVLNSLLLKLINKNQLEKFHTLSDLETGFKIVKLLRGKHTVRSMTVASVYLKGQIDILNDKASLISLMTVSGAFLTGLLFFEDKTVGNLIGSLAVWVLVIARIYIYHRLRILRNWQILIDQAK